jgi:hypothetical protein
MPMEWLFDSFAGPKLILSNTFFCSHEGAVPMLRVPIHTYKSIHSNALELEDENEMVKGRYL